MKCCLKVCSIIPVWKFIMFHTSIWNIRDSYKHIGWSHTRDLKAFQHYRNLHLSCTWFWFCFNWSLPKSTFRCSRRKVVGALGAVAHNWSRRCLLWFVKQMCDQLFYFSVYQFASVWTSWRTIYNKEQRRAENGPIIMSGHIFNRIRTIHP